MNTMNGIELETLNNTKLCWYCSNCKGCNARVSDMRMRCFDTYDKSFESEADKKAFIKINLDQHDSYLDYKMNKVQEIIDGRNQKKLDKKSKSKKPN